MAHTSPITAVERMTITELIYSMVLIPTFIVARTVLLTFAAIAFLQQLERPPRKAKKKPKRSVLRSKLNIITKKQKLKKREQHQLKKSADQQYNLTPNAVKQKTGSAVQQELKLEKQKN